MIGVRYRDDLDIGGGWEGKCATCKQYWPLEKGAFWSPDKGLRHCRGCLLDRQAEQQRARFVAKHGLGPEAYQRRLDRDRAYKRRQRFDPGTREALLARQREAQRRFYYNHHEESLKRRRDQEAAKRGGPPRPGIGRPRRYPDRP